MQNTLQLCVRDPILRRCYVLDSSQVQEPNMAVPFGAFLMSGATPSRKLPLADSVSS